MDPGLLVRYHEALLANCDHIHSDINYLKHIQSHFFSQQNKNSLLFSVFTQRTEANSNEAFKQWVEDPPRQNVILSESTHTEMLNQRMTIQSTKRHVASWFCSQMPYGPQPCHIYECSPGWVTRCVWQCQYYYSKFQWKWRPLMAINLQ